MIYVRQSNQLLKKYAGGYSFRYAHRTNLIHFAILEHMELGFSETTFTSGCTCAFLFASFI